MHEQILPRPWTCEWGRFGGPGGTAVVTDGHAAFWKCCHPVLRASPRPLAPEDCEYCAFWSLAPRLRPVRTPRYEDEPA